MELKLEITNPPDGSPDSLVHTFGAKGGSIGRGKRNSWVLPDPEKVISARHAKVIFENGEYYLEDTSTNGVFINSPEALIGKENRVRLNDGDQFYVGDYVIRVSLSEDVPSGESPPRPASDSFDDLFVDQDSGMFDPLRALDEGEPATSVPQGPDKLPADLFEPTTEVLAAQPDHAPALEEHFDPPSIKEAIPDDWDQPIGFEDLEKELPDEPWSNTLAESPAQAPAETVPPPAESAPPPAQSAPTAQRAAPATEQHLVRAFIRSAGLDESVELPDSEVEFMELIGEVFREFVQGLMQALFARSALKNEMRIQVTMLKPKENNPLKFSLTADDALENLLLKRGAGYMTPMESVQEGFQDVKDHQVGMMAAMQQAYEGVLQQFDPKLLEEGFSNKSKSKAVNRLKKLFNYWELYGEFYATLSKDTGDSFQKLFAKPFVDAYEKKIEELAKGRTENQSGPKRRKRK